MTTRGDEKTLNTREEKKEMRREDVGRNRRMGIRSLVLSLFCCSLVVVVNFLSIVVEEIRDY